MIIIKIKETTVNSLNLYNKENSTNNKIVVSNSQQSNSYMLPKYGGYFKVYERELTSPITITVGPGGQFSTLNEAFREAMKYDPLNIALAYDKPNQARPLITILLKTGFVMRESLYLTNGFNYGYIKIKTETYITCHRQTLKEDRTNTPYGLSFGRRAFFYGSYDVTYPILEGDFRVDTSGGTSESGNNTNQINLIEMRYGAKVTLSPGSKFEGGFSVVYINENSIVKGQQCTYKGHSYTQYVIRIHSGEIDCNRSIIELGTDLDPSIGTTEDKVCLRMTEGGIFRPNDITFKNSPKAIITNVPLLLFRTTFENITGNYAIGDAGRYGKGLIINASSYISKIGNAQLTDHGVNQFIPGKGLMIQ